MALIVILVLFYSPSAGLKLSSWIIILINSWETTSLSRQSTRSLQPLSYCVHQNANLDLEQHSLSA